ncbi:MAG: VTT domain-containing protein [Pseudomonadota bacterium]
MDWPLFLSALLSATLLPGSSEALLLYKLSEGGHALTLVLTAGAGNLLGSLVTYVMGRMGSAALHRRWLRIHEKDLDRAEAWFNRWGRPSLLLAWLPVVGDPLCLLAGLLRVGLVWFTVLVASGKVARYAFLAWVAT